MQNPARKTLPTPVHCVRVSDTADESAPSPHNFSRQGAAASPAPVRRKSVPSAPSRPRRHSDDRAQSCCSRVFALRCTDIRAAFSRTKSTDAQPRGCPRCAAHWSQTPRAAAQGARRSLPAARVPRACSLGPSPESAAKNPPRAVNPASEARAAWNPCRPKCKPRQRPPAAPTGMP